MYLLDSSAIIEILQGTDKSKEIHKIIYGNTVKTTSFSLHEIAVGEDETTIDTILNFFNNIDVLPFDINSAIISFSIEKKLRKEGKLINKIDMLIAGICQQHNLTIITLDKDFDKIKSIKAIVID